MHDITLPLAPGMVGWPGDPPLTVDALQSVAAGHPFTLHRISASTHAGTHIDAPRHLFPQGPSIDELDLARLIGVVEVVDVLEVNAIDADILSQRFPRIAPPRILFRTQNSLQRLLDQPQFAASYVALTESAAHWLVNHRVQCVGIDYLSVDRFDDESLTVHRILLAHHVAVLEAVRLYDVAPGRYQMIALPWKLRDMDGSPARVLLFTDREWAALSPARELPP
ncbi:MAG: cyclase family protein [Firmicutes bacterium]|nr:cyclase family protein [Bacillota bacterium]